MGITKDQVQCLSFEGGGGAGNGYIGALKALEVLGILETDSYFKNTKVKSFGGASAGAITSVLIASGFSSSELDTIMQLVDFEDFFDLSVPGEVPVPGGFSTKEINITERNVLNWISLTVQEFSKTQPYLSGASIATKLTMYLSNPKVLIQLVQELKNPQAVITFLSFLLSMAKDSDKLPQKVKTLLSQNTERVSQCIYNDNGIFLGKKIRLFVQTLLNYAKGRAKSLEYSLRITNLIIKRLDQGLTIDQAKQSIIKADLNDLKNLTNDLNTVLINFLRSKNIKVDDKGTTFKEFKEVFGCNLYLTGTNLETNKSQIFSTETTPNFYVEDAVRISMSLPMVYKPMIIRDNSLDFLNGVWIDGGYLNNSPMDIFDSNKTLGLRLERFSGPFKDERKDIKSLFDFLTVWPIISGVYGSGESHISETMTKLKNFNYVILNTRLPDYTPENKREIGLFDFKSPIFNEVNVNTYQAVLDYFNPAKDKQTK